MEPDDNFSPPLDGLTGGNKTHQILTTISNSDYVTEHTYNPDSDNEYDIIAVFETGRVVDTEDTIEVSGVLLANWWHMRREPDWFAFDYLEIDLNSIESDDSDGEEDQIEIPVRYACGWHREENEMVDSTTYFIEDNGDDERVEPFDPDLEAPKPLTRAVIDSYLPDNIRERHG